MSVHRRDKARSTSSSQPYAAPKVWYCRGCSRPCRSQSVLDSHQRSCPNMKLGKQESFFKLDPLRNGLPSNDVPAAMQKLMASGDEVTEKVLPASQPLSQSQDAQIPDISSPSDDVRPTAIDVELPTGNVVDTENISVSPEEHMSSSNNQTTSSPSSRSVETPAATPAGNSEANNCPICKAAVEDRGVECDMCSSWVHQTCLHMSDDEYVSLTQSDDSVKWYCSRCRQIKANNLKWGDHSGEENIQVMIKSAAYKTLIGWRKNIFRFPEGNAVKTS